MVVGCSLLVVFGPMSTRRQPTTNDPHNVLFAGASWNHHRNAAFRLPRREHHPTLQRKRCVPSRRAVYAGGSIKMRPSLLSTCSLLASTGGFSYSARHITP